MSAPVIQSGFNRPPAPDRMEELALWLKDKLKRDYQTARNLITKPYNWFKNALDENRQRNQRAGAKAERKERQELKDHLRKMQDKLDGKPERDDEADKKKKNDRLWALLFGNEEEGEADLVSKAAHKLLHGLRRGFKFLTRFVKAAYATAKYGAAYTIQKAKNAWKMRQAAKAANDIEKPIEAVKDISVAAKTIEGATKLAKDVSAIEKAAVAAKAVKNVARLSKLLKLVKIGGPVSAVITAAIMPAAAAAAVAGTAPNGESSSATAEKAARAARNIAFDSDVRKAAGLGSDAWVKGDYVGTASNFSSAAWQYSGIPSLWSYGKLAYNDPAAAKAEAQEMLDAMKDVPEVVNWAKQNPEEFRQALVTLGEDEKIVGAVRDGLTGDAQNSSTDMPSPSENRQSDPVIEPQASSPQAALSPIADATIKSRGGKKDYTSLPSSSASFVKPFQSGRRSAAGGQGLRVQTARNTSRNAVTGDTSPRPPSRNSAPAFIVPNVG